VVVLHGWLGDHTNFDTLLPYLDGTAFTSCSPICAATKIVGGMNVGSY
jgi:hypothetical protein